MEGLAIARNLFSGSEESVRKRVDEIREIIEALDNPGSVENRSVQTRELTVAEGYDRWASTYDEVTNTLTEVEHRELLDIVGSIPPGNAVDACCGSGRVSKILSNLGHNVRGFDQSEAMLALARKKNAGIPFDTAVLGDGNIAPRGDSDLVTCCFALTHCRSLSLAIHEIAGLLRPGGTAVISDIHPFFLALDSQSFFNAGDDSSPWVRNHLHHFSDYLQAFSISGLKIVECREVRPNVGEGPMQSLAGILRPEAAKAAYLGLPTVVIWVLEKTQ